MLKIALGMAVALLVGGCGLIGNSLPGVASLEGTVLSASETRREGGNGSRAEQRPIDASLRFVGSCAEEVATINETYVAASKGRCVDYKDQDIRVSSRVYEGPHGDLPYQIVSPADERKIERLVLYIHGGPFSGSGIKSRDGVLGSWQTAAAKEGTVFVIPFYLGSRERSVYPNSDLPLALEELESFLSEIEKHFTKDIVLTGSSTGAFMAAVLSQRTKASSAVLISPILPSPEELFQRATHGDPPKIPINLYQRFHQYDLINGIAVPGRKANEPRIELNPKFFEPYKKYRLKNFITSSPRTCFSVLVGLKDWRIGVEQIDDLKGLPNVRLITMNDYYHRPESWNQHAVWYGKIDALIANAENCRGAPRSAN